VTVRIILSDLFQKTQADVDGSVKGKVLDFVVKLQQNPAAPGLRLKTPQGVEDSRIKVGRVNDFWRAVVIELPNGTGYVLAAVKPHDLAYDYAAGLRFGVNEVTGALEVVDQVATMQAMARGAELVQADAPPILGGVRANHLVAVGVAADVAERLVTITDEDLFFELVDTLPRAQGDAVLDLASGRTPEEVWADFIDHEPETEIDTEDVEAALQRPISRFSFVPMENTEEFQAAFAGSFESWRVWLHPLQRRLAEHVGWNGPFRVTGGAGTGKTVTAVHRAHHLAARLDEQGAPETERVLVTTFTRNLARAIQAMLVKVGGKALLDRVDVVNVDALAQRTVRASGADGGRRLLGDTAPEVQECWELACTGDVAELCDVDFLQAEWRDVVLAQGLTARDDYLHAPRSGRGRRLSRPQRAVVWQGIERFMQLMDSGGLLTFTQVADRAAHAASPAYAFGVVDEAQDLHPAHWRLIRAVVPPGQDDLFIAGDSHQRIYGHPVVLSRCGIETRGRSRRLTVNYRTSRQILRWCLAVAAGEAVDDLEGDQETLAGARSMFDGPEPEQSAFSTATDEAAAVAGRVASWREEGLAWAEIAVIAREGRLLDPLVKSLRHRSIPTVRADANRDEDALGDRVRLMTMHRAKGLEFRAVALVAVGSQHLPAPYVSHLGDEPRELELAKERSLLYVAGSRARERLWVSWTRSPSVFLPHRSDQD